MKKIILSILICMLILPMVMASCYKYEPIRLMNGYNGVSIITDYNDLTNQDINLTLIIGYNFLGYSAIDSTNLNNLKFYDVTDTEKTYQQALTSNWITEIEFTNSTLTTSGSKGNKLSTYVGYWIYSTNAVKMTIPNVNGESVGNTFNWADLKFSNGTEELNITEAQSNNWITGYIQYWDTNNDGFRYVCSEVYSGPGSPVSVNCLADSVESYRGHFIKSNQDNIYLLTNNETTACKTKIKFKADKPKLTYKVKAEKSNLIMKLKINHLIRLFGGTN